MKKNFKYFGAFFSMLMCALSVFAGGGAFMAIAGTVPDTNQGTASTGVSGTKQTNPNGGQLAEGNANATQNYEGLEGVASQTENDRMQANAGAAEDFDSRGLSKTIIEIQPMRTPYDQLTRYATSGEKPEGMKFEYAAIGSRPTETKIATGHPLSITGANVSNTLYVDDPAMFSVDDVILVPEYHAVTDYQGVAYSTKYNQGDEAWPCLQLKVCGFDDANSMPVVYAMNGNLKNGSPIQINSVLPVAGGDAVSAIPAGKKLLRIAKAVNEGAAQTGRTAELPNTETQFLQIFMVQTEESLIHKLTKRDVNGLDLAWSERRTLEDMRMVQEGTFLFSDMTCIQRHPKENLNKVWTTKGSWYQAGKDVTLGHLENGNLVINEDDLVDVNSAVYVGEGTGGAKKLWFCGSEMISALEKIKSEKFRLKGDVQAWDLTFTSWKTTFGENLCIYDQTLDKYGKADMAFSLDPEYFEKKVLLSMDRNAMDLNALGIRATQAVVLKEISAVVLYCPNAHARIKLAK